MADTVARWTAQEVELRSAVPRAHPYRDVDVQLACTAPSGKRVRVDAFWDGGDVWRARIRPDEVGQWQWRSVASDAADPGLHDVSGTFECVPYDGPNPVYRHGPVRVSDDRRSLAHADGLPFLWLGDTVWNGLIRSTLPDWEHYLDTRRAQGFSVVQCFTTQWRALAADPEGNPSFSETDGVFSPNPAFYQRLDTKVKAVADHGMLASLIVLLSLYDDEAGWSWPPEQLVRYGRWVRARWGAWHVAWSLGGDGDFTGARAERWKPIGQQIYTDPPEALVTMHPRGWSWCAPEFRDQPWFTFVIYQSGHSDVPEKVRWLPNGSAAADWRTEPVRPIINVEPNYEDHPSRETGVRFTDHDVRRATYWSLLVTPTAGVAYGHFSLWAWAGEPEPVGDAIRGQSDYVLEPWWTVLDTPGVRGFGIARRFLESGPWTTLVPAQELLLEQPGAEDVLRFVVAARSELGGWIIAYAPLGGRIRLGGAAASLPSARWFDPQTGHWRGAVGVIDGDGLSFEAPDVQDWVLDLRR